jgi:histidinol dehydrogenase
MTDLQALLPSVGAGSALAILKARTAAAVEPRAAEIVDDIRRRGDPAVFHWARELDGFEGSCFEVDRDRIDAAPSTIAPELRKALEDMASRVCRFAGFQRGVLGDLSVEMDGILLGHRAIPVSTAACYAPGGRHPLPSSVIMSAVTARAAGVENVYVFGPSMRPEILAAICIAGADRAFEVGGAQGIAAASWGLAGLPRADMVAGPGNRFVDSAKRLVWGSTGVDLPAGPSELLVIASDDADPGLVALDLLAQAEHDVDAFPALVCFSRGFAESVRSRIREELSGDPGSVAAVSLARGLTAEVDDDSMAVEIADAMSPEHLELAGRRSEALADRLRNYGSLFIGQRSAEVFGDYGSGANHILPTGGAARFTGGLWVGSFLRIATWQQVGEGGSPGLAAQAATIAAAEGLRRHAESAAARKACAPPGAAQGVSAAPGQT